MEYKTSLADHLIFKKIDIKNGCKNDCNIPSEKKGSSIKSTCFSNNVSRQEWLVIELKAITEFSKRHGVPSDQPITVGVMSEENIAKRILKFAHVTQVSNDKIPTKTLLS